MKNNRYDGCWLPLRCLWPFAPRTCARVREHSSAERTATATPRLQNSRKSKRRSCRGLTLLEVLLALAIFGGALVAIGELMRIGSRNAEMARDLTTAQIISETIMSEIGIGLLPPQTMTQTAVDDVQYQHAWVFSIAVEQVDQEGLIAVWVTVEQRPELSARPARFTLVRWMIDPMTLETQES